MNPSCLQLAEREREILRATVNEYIASAKPVGSKWLSEQYFPELSSATIRHVLAHLENLGLLQQPHASAGRIPTESGFHYYIHSLLEPQHLSSAEKAALTVGYGTHPHTLDSIRETPRFLSRISNQMGVVTAPKLDSTVFKQIQFVRIDADKILTIFIAKNGIIEQRVVHWENPPSQDDLWKMSGYLNALLENLTLAEVRACIALEMKKEQIRYNSLLANALKLQHLFFDQKTTLEVFVDGHSHLMEQPEFADSEKLAFLFHAFEQKHLLLRLLELAERQPQDATRIVLGEELEEKEFSGLAFVTRCYGTPDEVLGALAIAGPTRMNYGRIVPIVNFTAETLNGLFNKTEQDERSR